METEAWCPGCSGSLWKTRSREATQSEAQGHRPVGAAVSSGPALRCSGSALSDRWAGGALQ